MNSQPLSTLLTATQTTTHSQSLLNVTIDKNHNRVYAAAFGAASPATANGNTVLVADATTGASALADQARIKNLQSQYGTGPCGECLVGLRQGPVSYFQHER